MEEEIPIIDMQENNKSSKVIIEACEKWGCFRVINHGIPAKLMAEIRSVGFDLFNRTVEIKQKYKSKIPGSGYLAPTPYTPFYEAFGIDITSLLSLPSFFDDLQATPLQREIIEKYTEAVEKLANEIMSALLEDCNTKVWVAHFRMNQYDVTHDRIGSDGLSLHTDSSLFTILQDDENLGGLEVINPNGDRIPAGRFPGSLFVNLGDIVVPWSNGKYKSNLHRVVGKDIGKRLSIASAITPNIGEDIKVHPKFNEEGHPPKYIPFTFEELRNLRSSKMLHAGQVLDLLLCKT